MRKEIVELGGSEEYIDYGTKTRILIRFKWKEKEIVEEYCLNEVIHELISAWFSIKELNIEDCIPTNPEFYFLFENGFTSLFTIFSEHSHRLTKVLLLLFIRFRIFRIVFQEMG